MGVLLVSPLVLAWAVLGVVGEGELGNSLQRFPAWYAQSVGEFV